MCRVCVRRGKPSSHKKFDEATAILAGDALQAAAFGALARTPNPKLVAPMGAALSEAAGASGMVGGQQLDLSPRAPIAKVHALKTAALFSVSARLGALAAGSPHVERLARYGLRLGLAFQLTDDILDESERGQRNYAKMNGINKARRLATREIAAALTALRPLGPSVEPLRALADKILSRNQ